MITYKSPDVILMHSTPLHLAEIAGRTCYDSFSMSEHQAIREFKDSKCPINTDIDESELLDKLVNVYFHESVVEHINLTYYISKVSREIIIEANRHRIGIATSQKSSRYTIESLINSFLEIYGTIPIHSASAYKDTAFYKCVRDNIVHNTTEAIDNTVNYIYTMLCMYHKYEPLVAGLTGGAKKKQNDRVKRALPESWMLEGVWTFNLRSLKHFLELRTSGGAYYGIRELAIKIAEATPHKYRVLIDKKYKKNIIKENNEN